MYDVLSLVGSGFIDMKKHMVSNLSTVAVVPITSNAPLAHFTRELCAAVKAIGELNVSHKKAKINFISMFCTCYIAPAMRLTSDFVQKELGSTALER